jgi:hypothetical protein
MAIAEILKIVSGFDFILPLEDNLLQELEEIKVPFQSGERHPEGHVKYGRFNATRGFVQFNRKSTDLV